MARKPDVLVRTYTGRTHHEAGFAFEADARAAAQHGYEPTSRNWDGRELKVVYQREPRPSLASSAREHAATIVTVAGGMVMLLGLVLPWATWSGGFDAGALSGLEFGGVDQIIVGATALITVAGGVLSRPLLATLGALAGGAFAALGVQVFEERLAVAASELVHVSVGAITFEGDAVLDDPALDEAAAGITSLVLDFDVGIGLWAVVAGAVIALVGASGIWIGQARSANAG